MIHLIVSVGTSSITNIFKWLDREKKLLKKIPTFSPIFKEYLKIRENEQNILPFLNNKITTIELADDNSEMDTIIKELVTLLNAGNTNVLSAEINTIQHLNFEQENTSIKITLFATDTAVGKFCAKIIQEFLSQQKFICTIKTISGFSYESLEDFEKGLVSFTNTMISTISESFVEKEELGLIITGGFKAQIVYSAIIAMLFDIPIFYYNEQFSNAFLLPPLPLKLNKKFWVDFKDYLNWFKIPRSSEEIRCKMESIPNELQFFIEKKDKNKQQLSALGKILIQLYSSDFYEIYT
ncbi:MAG: putative CRISPR-associated protein [Candidatus Helarchaeota archaeon]